MNKVFEVLKKNKVVQIIILLAIVSAFYFYSTKETLENITLEEPEPEKKVEAVEPKEQEEAPVSATVELNPEDLLPQYDEANEFAQQNPVSKLLKEQNFLVSGYHSGINTVMQSNKIAYHDLRSAPPIPKTDVGPFNQSSFEKPAGSNRRQFELGSA